jgi:nitroimidazol reductase NimA-like FMN-containing flavoprotein (pyridoxamine 5'-phosphate oxidase superfamily)
MKILNGAPGLGRKMSKIQINRFLCSGKMNLQFATIDRKNEPNIHPVWYIYENGMFYFATETKSKKIQNIRQSKTVYFSIANEEEPFMGVRGKGKSKILENKDQNSEIAKKILVKYLDGANSNLAKEIISEIKQGLEVIVEIKPKYFSTWIFGS